MFTRLDYSLIYLLISCSVGSRTVDVPAVHTEEVLKIDLDEKHSLELLQHWLDQAVSGLMAAVASSKLEKVPNVTKDRHEHCSKNAATVPDHARCVVQLMDYARSEWRRIKEKDGEDNIVLEKNRKPGRSHKKLRKRKRRKHFKTKNEGRKLSSSPALYKDEGWIGRFKIRDKRSVISKSSYSLHSNQENPFISLAKSLKKTVREMKKKDDGGLSKDWKEIVDEIQEEGKKMKARKMLTKIFAKKLASIQEDTAEGNVNSRRPLAMKALDDIEELDPKDMLEEARKMERKLSKEDTLMTAPIKLIREAVKIGMLASGKNASEFDDKTLKLFSPRMMSVVPEEEATDEVDFLSPSLLSLHKEGSGIERATSLADGFGLVKDPQHEEWLNFVMEAAGVTDAIEWLKEEKIKKALGQDDMISPSGQPLYFTKENATKILGPNETKKIDIFEQLQGTYTQEQIAEQNRSGYFILTPDQLRLVYGPGSPYHDEERLKTLTSIPTTDIPQKLEENIRAISTLDSFKVRLKNDVLVPAVGLPLIFQSLIVSGPIVLAPLLLSPMIFSPAILGVVVLSPAVFVPIILSPRVFRPIVLNPLVFVPLILSPLIGVPLILSPGVGNPLILSPLVFSPFIMSPQVFTPLILTPFVLNPVILHPTVASPIILSPFVLSPIIRSDMWLFAVVLSPSVLSPVIDSDFNGAEIILSPSALS